jgi:hypothetical protein
VTLGDRGAAIQNAGMQVSEQWQHMLNSHGSWAACAAILKLQLQHREQCAAR